MFKLGINASRARSGGAVAHLVGVLSEVDPHDFGINEVHVWAHQKLSSSLPNRSWLIKHSPDDLEKALIRQLFWERFKLPRELRATQCSILLNVDAGSMCRFSPAVTMSRDMLSYEKTEIMRYPLGLNRLRLYVLRYVQNASFRKADGVIFLTRYASETVQRSCGDLSNVAFIPHGVGQSFRLTRHSSPWPDDPARPIRCLYISNALPYKHQWNVVEAVAALRKKEINIQLELIGGGSGEALVRLAKQVNKSDPTGEFVRLHDFVPQSVLSRHLANADLFVFASSCENMPNTLVEAMAIGLPIACSNRGPMPEILQDGGVYFDPESSASIALAVEEIIVNPEKRQAIAARSKEISLQFSWCRCAEETFAFLARTLNR